MTSALFSVNGSSVQQAHAVTAASTVTLALVDTSGVNTVSWAVTGQAIENDTPPTITVVSKTTASFVMTDPTPYSAAFLITCVVNNGIGANGRPDAALTCGRVIGVASPVFGIVPICSNETTERGASAGWVSVINQVINAPAAERNPVGIVPLDRFVPGNNWGVYQTGAINILQQTTASAVYATAEITDLLVNGATLSAVWMLWDGGLSTHEGLPTLPTIVLSRCAIGVSSSATLTAIATGTDPSVTLGGYETAHVVSGAASPVHVVDLTQYRYWITVNGESGDNGTDGNGTTEVRFTSTGP